MASQLAFRYAHAIVTQLLHSTHNAAADAAITKTIQLVRENLSNPLRSAYVAKSLKEMVVMTGWMATALSEWRGRCYVPTKKECPDIFTRVIGGNVAKAFSGHTELCRNDFFIGCLPLSNSRRESRLSCRGLSRSKNYFLEHYQHFLIENLANSNSVRRRASVVRLGEIRYPTTCRRKHSGTLRHLMNRSPPLRNHDRFPEDSLMQSLPALPPVN